MRQVKQVQNIINTLHKNYGIVFFAAAGNEAKLTTTANNKKQKDFLGDNIEIPADLENVESVASVDTDNRLSHFSNCTNSTDMAAAGEQISVVNYDGSTEAYAEGTSFAAPVAAGVAALLLEKSPKSSASKIVSAMKSQSAYMNPEYEEWRGSEQSKPRVVNATKAYNYLYGTKYKTDISYAFNYERLITSLRSTAEPLLFRIQGQPCCQEYISADLQRSECLQQRIYPRRITNCRGLITAGR